MPGTKEIRAKIASVKSTQKITKAMQMVATSKMRRAQERMKLARPYAKRMLEVIGHLTEANPDYRHPFLVTREPKAVGIIVISSDRGLAGALNANVFRETLKMIREWQGKGVTVSLCLIGTKALNFFRRLSLPILANVTHLGDRPHVKDLIGTVKVMLDGYRKGELDRLLLVNAQFVNTMTQKPVVQQLLPIEALDTEGLQEHWDYIYEPDAAGILDGLLMRYIESQVYRA
ncbi:MAG TPA: ATP synthase F1 subunit gamma, partial [Steroidobacteraceae bacterium]|nr:ATP synthase F1 subunit gamma [Steroidobacteraceae bacterium]